MMSQSIALSKKPHFIVCTPGRLNDHLENTKGFSLRNIKYLVRLSFRSASTRAHRFSPPSPKIETLKNYPCWTYAYSSAIPYLSY
jgi:hypothetical protein